MYWGLAILFLGARKAPWEHRERTHRAAVSSMLSAALLPDSLPEKTDVR